MPTHLSNPQGMSDDQYFPGALRFLSVGNKCRLLDRRRTPGTIVGIDFDGGYFRWEISDFEDKGKIWDVVFERATSYQFAQDSVEIDISQLTQIQERISCLSGRSHIIATEAVRRNTDVRLTAAMEEALRWLNLNSMFLKSTEKLDFQDRVGHPLVREDFNKYISFRCLADIEKQTADVQVMNPHSGDRIRALQTVMAEMGLKAYHGEKIRSPRTFENLGGKELLERYICHRIGFLRAFFQRLEMSEVELFRGMSTEWDWKAGELSEHRFWSSWTFNSQVAFDFSDLDLRLNKKTHT